MNKLIGTALATFLSFTTMTLIGQEYSKTDSILITKEMELQEQAWNQGDLEGFMQGYWKSDSLRFIGSRGLTYGWDATLANYKMEYPDVNAMGRLNFDILHLDCISIDAFLMTGRYTLIREKDEPSGYFVLLWRKIKGRWVVVSDITASKI